MKIGKTVKAPKDELSKIDSILNAAQKRFGYYGQKLPYIIISRTKKNYFKR